MSAMAISLANDCSCLNRWIPKECLKVAPSKGCADLVFLWLLLWQTHSCFCHTFILTNLSACCFFVIWVFSQLAIWLLTDMLFSLFWGAYITPFWWVLLLKKFAVVHRVLVTQCAIPMQIRYLATNVAHPCHSCIVLFWPQLPHEFPWSYSQRSVVLYSKFCFVDTEMQTGPRVFFFFLEALVDFSFNLSKEKCK